MLRTKGGSGLGSNNDKIAISVKNRTDGFNIYSTDKTSPVFNVDGVENTVNIIGDLSVTGNAVFTNIDNVDVDSSMISLATNNPANIIDIGYFGKYVSSGVKYAGMARRATNGRFVIFDSLATKPNATFDYASSTISNLEVNDLYFGNSGDSLSVFRADLAGFQQSLKNLTAAEITQLVNINSNIISSAQWGYLSALDQSLTTTSSPTFVNITGTLTTASQPNITQLGTLTSLASTGAITVTRSSETSINLSGGASTSTSIALGRTATEARFGIAGATNAYTTGSVAGDAILCVDSSSRKLHLLAGTGAPVITVTNANVGIGTTSPNAPLQFSNGLVNRKVVLYDTNNNDHQYYGFGINTAILRYQTESTGNSHVFYAGTSSTTSTELMRVMGTGSMILGGASSVPTGMAKMQIIGTNTSTAGPHMQFITASDNYPLLQQLNWSHDNIQYTFDGYSDGTNDRRSHTTATYRMCKYGGLLYFQTAAASTAGSIIGSWTNALVIDATGNTILGGTSIPTGVAKLQVYGTNGSSAGPHVQFVTSADNYPLVQQFNSTHDNIMHCFDCYTDGATDRRSHTSVPHKIYKVNGLLYFQYSTASTAGSTIASWSTSMAITATGNIVLGGASIPTGAAKFQIYGTDTSTAGPHVQYVTSLDNYPLYQQLNWAHDNVWQSFDGYWDGTNWRRSHVSVPFRILKNESTLRFQYTTASTVGSIISSTSDAVVIDASGNTILGGSSIAAGIAKLHVYGTTSSAAGPHVQYVASADNYPLVHQVNWAHDSISMHFDAYFDGTNLRRSHTSAAFRIYKATSLLNFEYVAASTANSTFSYSTAMTINASGKIGIGTTGQAGDLSIVKTTASGEVGMRILNNSATGYQALRLGQDIGGSVGLTIHHFNASWASPTSWYSADGSNISAYGAGGLSIGAQNAAGSIRFFTGATPTEHVTLTSDGKLLVGRNTIPVGASKFQLYGTYNSAAGPHMQFVTTEDNYPVMQHLPMYHDNAAVMFDAYYNGTTELHGHVYAFKLHKYTGVLSFMYSVNDPGLAASWVPGLSLDASGLIGIGTMSPDGDLSIVKSKGDLTMRICNTSTAGIQTFRMGQDLANDVGLLISCFNTAAAGYDTYYYQDGSAIASYGAGGLSLVAKHATSAFRIFTGTSATERITVSAAGGVSFNSNTITSAVWNGTVIDPSYGGTGVNNGSSTITLGGNLVTSGAYASTFTMTGTTALTFPTSGTLVTTANTVASITGTANQVIASASTGAVTLSLPQSIGTSSTPTFAGQTINGGVTINRANNTAINCLSGSSNAFTNISVGRTASECDLGIAGNSGQYSSSAVAGDVVLRNFGGGKMHLLCGSGSAVITMTTANVGIGHVTPNAPLQFSNELVNRKIVLYEAANNDHQFNGFGQNGNVLRYQVNGSGDNHVFYCGASTTTSTELMRVMGTGYVGIGTSTPRAQLHLGNTIVNRKIVLFEDINNDHQFYGFGINGGVLRYQTPNGASHVFYVASSSTASSESLRITGAGYVGIGTSSPGGDLSIVKASAGGICMNINNTTATGYSALRLGIDNGTGSTGATFHYFNASWGSTGAYYANGLNISSFGTGGITIAAQSGSGSIRLYTGGANERITIASSGSISFNSNTITSGTWNGSIIAAAYGGTNNGYTQFSGPATSTKTFTLPNASCTILTTNDLLTVSQGGLGLSTYATGDMLIASSPNELSNLNGNSSNTPKYLRSLSTTAPLFKAEAPTWQQISSDELIEGSTNLFYTNSRSRSSISAGSGITYDSSTGIITNSGSPVTSITGTTNQIIASSSTGTITLSLPQSIATTSYTQFTRVGAGISPSYAIDVEDSTSKTTAKFGDTYPVYLWSDPTGVGSTGIGFNIYYGPNTATYFLGKGSTNKRGSAIMSYSGGGDLYFSTTDVNASFGSGGGLSTKMYLSNIGQLCIGSSSPNASSILDVQSTTKGFLMPRVTRTQRLAISSPAMGLQVFDTDSLNVYMYLGLSWVSMPPCGSIQAYVSTTAPQGWLVCDGSAVSRTTYAELFAIIATAYGYGDNLTTFNLPTTQGMFLRGRANGSANDPDRATRTAIATGGNIGDNIGSKQGWQIESHNHQINGYNNVGTDGAAVEWTSGGDIRTANLATGGNQTNPINIYVQYIIKF